MTNTRKRRRTKGTGSVYKQGNGRVWWISYTGPDGKRKAESTGSERKGDAMRLLLRRTGAREHNLPVIPGVERVTFEVAAQAMVDDFTNSGKKSLDEVQRRIRLHLQPYFGGRRIVGITSTDVRSYVAKRRTDTFVVRKGRVVVQDDGTEQIIPEVRKAISAAEINRELQILKRILNLAVKDGKLSHRPHIAMLREDNVRQGFFEVAQITSVLAHLPAELRPVITFAYLTGWRIASEVLPLEWRQVDFEGGEVRLDAGTTKNRDGRVFPLTAELRRVLQAQHSEHLRLKKTGHIFPQVFFREVASGRGGDKKPRGIVSFKKAWQAACVAAGCPGRIPHDLRRTAVRNLVRAGVPQTVAMKMTGHKTDSVFRRYDIVSEGDLRDAARKLDSAGAAITA